MNDWGVEKVTDAYKNGDNEMKDKISIAFTKKSNQPWENIKKNISEMGKEDFDKKVDDLGLYDLEEEKKGLYYYINRNKKMGKKPARKGSEAFKKAYSAMRKINKNK